MRITPLFLLSLLLATTPCLAKDDPLKDFRKAWKAAGADPDQRAAALKGLAASPSIKAVKLIIKRGFDKSSGYRVHDAAFEALKGIDDDDVMDWIVANAPKQRRVEQRVILTRVIAGYDDASALKGLSLLVKDKSRAVQVVAVDSLRNIKSKEAISAVIGCLQEAKGTLADACRTALKKLTGKIELHNHDEWSAWWTGAKEAFDPSKISRSDPDRHSSGTKTVTRDGSGLYETISSEAVIFVVDVSGSMKISWRIGTSESSKKMSRLDYVKRELSAAIQHQLNDGCRFNVIAFDTKIVSWKGKLTKATSGAKSAAIKWIKALKPGEETNIHGALVKAFKDKEADTIYFLTDGTPSAGETVSQEEILGNLRQWNRTRSLRIHTIACLTGNGRDFGVLEDKTGSRDFMQRMADENEGSFRAIE